jgi:hypothetical protein
MTNVTELWVDRTNFRKTNIVHRDIEPIEQGQVLVAIDRFSLTSNNVTYAVVGDNIGYWGYYPASDNWGKVPAWGCANVIESTLDEISVGERIWGFFPMASHVVLQPGKIRQDQWFDMAEHRQSLPALYNVFRRTQAEPELLTQMENERCLLFPLFTTSFLIADFLLDNQCFGAEQIVIGSVSSKTGFGLAKILRNDPAISQRIIGFTSAANVDFVTSLQCCDEVLVYGDEAKVDANIATAFVDMSGDVRLTSALHHHLQDNMLESCMVGATHWEGRGDISALPGARPHMFFAPGQVDKRNKDWGPGVVMQKGTMASAEVAQSIKDDISIEWTLTAPDLEKLWCDMLDNKISAKTGQMVSLS